MHIIKFFIFICLFESCHSQRDDETFIPKEYQYPEDSILNGKTFVYQKSGTSEKNYTDFKLKIIDNKKWLISVQYSADKTEDSVLTLNDKTKEIYSFSFNDGKPLNGLVAQDTVINDGTKLGKRIKRTVFKTDDYTSDNTSQLEYLKDTIFTWKSRKIDCIVMKAVSTTQLINNSDSSRQALSSFHNLYFGKNIGLVKYSTDYKEEHYMFELTEINDIK